MHKSQKKNAQREAGKQSLEVVRQLISKKAYTATALAEELGCSKVAAYRWLKRLREEEKSRVFVRVVREGERGPHSEEYFLA